MAKRRTYEDKLLDQLNGLPPMKWFLIKGRDDFEKITVAVKGFINAGEQFEFSSCYSKIKRLSNEYQSPCYHQMKYLPVGITVETLEVGMEEEIQIKNRKIRLTHNKKSYRIFVGDKLISIE